MRKKCLLIIAVLVVVLCNSGVVISGNLIIGDGSTLTINGSTLDINCSSIYVQTGGSLLLQSGTIRDLGSITVDPGATYDNSGTVVNCESGPTRTIIIIPFPNSGLVIPVALPE